MCKDIENKTRHLHLLGETIETCTAVQQTICSEDLLKVFAAACWHDWLKSIQKSSHVCDVVRYQMVIFVNFALLVQLRKGPILLSASIHKR